jgi:CubicO group peptidase (beta-lactamase class C family)
MAKIGQLVLAGGSSNHRQIVSRAWIDASMTPHINSTGLYFYGYLWWLGRSLLKGREIRWAAAFGRGGQSIYIVPERDLVVVVTAGYYQDYSPRRQQVLAGVFRDVLRAASSPG